MAVSNVTKSGESAAANEILECPEAWATAMEPEWALGRDPGLVDGGTLLVSGGEEVGHEASDCLRGSGAVSVIRHGLPRTPDRLATNG